MPKSANPLQTFSKSPNPLKVLSRIYTKVQTLAFYLQARGKKCEPFANIFQNREPLNNPFWIILMVRTSSQVLASLCQKVRTLCKSPPEGRALCKSSPEVRTLCNPAPEVRTLSKFWRARAPKCEPLANLPRNCEPFANLHQKSEPFANPDQK